MKISDEIRGSRQLIVVTAPDWESVRAQGGLYERRGGSWKLKKRMSAVLGETGMAWGLGLHPKPRATSGPLKTEGDGKSPAGVFALGSAYGTAAVPLRRMKWPYRPSTLGLRCIDDPKSRHYNTVVTETAAKDWRSAEKMVREDGLYRWVIAVQHNPAPAVPSKGSCIFIHLWKSRGAGTSGCTALSREHIEFLLRWLDPAARPLLIQLPSPVYESIRQEWGLPFKSVSTFK